ncbi:hypothetical protein PO909_000035 [Leuciscus waleckii]
MEPVFAIDLCDKSGRRVSLTRVPGRCPTEEISSTLTCLDAELMSILLEAVADMGLDWATPEQPSKRWMDGSFLCLEPCRATAHIAEKAYVSAGYAASALHTMAVLQVFQTRLLRPGPVCC